MLEGGLTSDSWTPTPPCLSTTPASLLLSQAPGHGTQRRGQQHRAPHQQPSRPGCKSPRASPPPRPGLHDSGARRHWGLSSPAPLTRGEGPGPGSHRPPAHLESASRAGSGQERLLAALAHPPSTPGLRPPVRPSGLHWPPPQRSRLHLHPSRSGVVARTDLVCPEEGASPPPPSGSEPGPPAPRAGAAASHQKRPGWQGRRASCGGKGRGPERGAQLPAGGRQSHTSGQQARCPPGTAPPGWGHPQGTTRSAPQPCAHILPNGHAHPVRAKSLAQRKVTQEMGHGPPRAGNRCAHTHTCTPVHAHTQLPTRDSQLLWLTRTTTPPPPSGGHHHRAQPPTAAPEETRAGPAGVRPQHYLRGWAGARPGPASAQAARGSQ